MHTNLDTSCNDAMEDAELEAVSGGSITEPIKTAFAVAENVARTVVDVASNILLHASDGWL